MRQNGSGGTLRRSLLAVALVWAGVAAPDAAAQARQAAPPPVPPGPAQVVPPGRSQAPIDLTGTWVSVVTEDWPYRMLTPAPRDYTSVPLNPAGIAAADTWDLQADNAAGLQCKAFGAAALMRVPTRLRIRWDDDFTLRIDADAGTQTRLLRFSRTGRRPMVTMLFDGLNQRPSWQGYSVADWENTLIDRAIMQNPRRGGPPRVAPPGGNLKVVTTRMRPGYLRSNGVPYSDEAILTEYFSTFTAPNADRWFVVTSIVEDPKYLTHPYVTTSHFRREADDARWKLTPCETWAPPGAAAPR